MTEKESNTVMAVETAFDVLEGIYRLDGASVTELASAINRPKSTVFKHLDTLRNLGYVLQDDDGEYVLARKFALFAQTGKLRDDLYVTARPHVDQLSKTTEASTGLYVGDDGGGIDLYRSFTGHEGSEIRYPRLSRHLHCTAPGKAILATLDRADIEAIIDRHGLPHHTQYTITDRDELFDELEGVRKQGFAFDREEQTEGIHSVAVSVDRSAGIDGAGAVYLVGLSTRLTGKRFEEDLPGMLMDTVDRIVADLE